MNMSPQIIELALPLIICILASLPFICIPSLHEKDEDIDSALYHAGIIYMIFLGLIAFGLLIIETTIVMPVQNGNRSLFICSVLLIGCLDQIIDLSPARAITAFNLISRLFYFVIILSSIPAFWYASKRIVPQAISSQSNIMVPVEAVLILVMITLSMVHRFDKKRKTTEIT